MAEKNRETLKNYFKAGCVPRQEHFEHLIDSALNIQDDGFSRSKTGGLKIYSNGKDDALINFYRKAGKDGGQNRPLWLMGLEDTKDQLIYSCGKDNEEPLPVITLNPQLKKKENKDEHRSALKVHGGISSLGRMGSYQELMKRSTDKANLTTEGYGQAEANTVWQTIIEGLKGSNGFEIVASVSSSDNKRHALLHAIALNAHNPCADYSKRNCIVRFFKACVDVFTRKSKIRYTQAYHYSYFDKLRLRWVGDKNNYRLQIKTNGDYGGDMIKYHITALWIDAENNDK